MLKYLYTHFILCLLVTLSACSGSDIKQYANNTPTFTAEQFFNGKLTAHGVLKNRSGEVTRYFTATIDASWSDAVGTLVERFEFNDGEIQHRTWTLTPIANQQGQYLATAGDVIGNGLAQVSGNAMKLDYSLQINYRGSPMVLAVEDWMWLVDKNTIINQSILRKWGIQVGSIQLVITKQPATEHK